MLIPFESFSARVRQARRSGDLFFASLLSRQTIDSVFGDATDILGSARVYDTAITLWVFLSQVLSVHHGCVPAVAKLITYRVAKGMRACSAETGAYCIAPDKLDEGAMHRLVVHTGAAIDTQAPADRNGCGTSCSDSSSNVDHTIARTDCTPTNECMLKDRE